ncbi:MAG: dTMP kinase [Parcubacteria group bacterium]|nr:dTMP kinase [Parcubacteria group bacterium]
MSEINPGIFITFEGGDKSGKTTLVSSLYEYFLSSGIKVISTREPGGTDFGERIRQVLKSRDAENIDPWTEFFLLCAGRCQHIVDVISPKLKDGYLILCDRFTASTFAYQHYGRGLSLEAMTPIEAIARKRVYPGLTILLDIDPRLTILRRSEVELDKFDQESLVFHQVVREGYLAQLQQEPRRWFMIDATLSPEDVFQKARDKILELLKQK